MNAKENHSGTKCGALQLRLPGWATASLLKWSVCEILSVTASQGYCSTSASQGKNKDSLQESGHLSSVFSVWGRCRCGSDYVHQFPQWSATDSPWQAEPDHGTEINAEPQYSAPITEAEHWVTDKHEVLFRAHTHVSMPQTGLRLLLAVWMPWDN